MRLALLLRLGRRVEGRGFYGGLGLHSVIWEFGDADSDIAYNGVELLGGVAVPLRAEGDLVGRAQFTYLPVVLWDVSDSTPGEAFDADGNTDGHTWDIGLSYHRDPWSLSVGYRAMHFNEDRDDSPDGVFDWVRIFDEDFDGPYVEVGITW